MAGMLRPTKSPIALSQVRITMPFYCKTLYVLVLRLYKRLDYTIAGYYHPSIDYP